MHLDWGDNPSLNGGIWLNGLGESDSLEDIGPVLIARRDFPNRVTVFSLEDISFDVGNDRTMYLLMGVSDFSNSHAVEAEVVSLEILGGRAQ
jgi:hypothetical protein